MGSKQCRVAVLASGTGTNFRALAEACREQSYPAELACLITDNPAAPALEIARRFGIASHTIDCGPKKGRLPHESEERIVSVCLDSNVGLVALAGFMRILKGPLIDSFQDRIMNIHPALLPSFKGLHAVRQAMEYGVKVTGCTVHLVDRSIDGGPIILQSAVDIREDDDEDSLLERIHEQEHRTYVKAVELFAKDRLHVEGRRVRIG
jgi:phosphoribosylglycinamide formyltransferase-1